MKAEKLPRRKFGDLVLEENQYVTWITVDYPGYTPESTRLLRAINAQWDFFPKTINDKAPDGLAEVHHRMHMSESLPILVTIDKNGNKTFEIVKEETRKPARRKTRFKR